MATEITTANAATINGILEALQQEPVVWGSANLKRTFAKLAQLTAERATNQPDIFDKPRYKIATIGDSIMWAWRQVLVPYLQAQHGWGGIIGRIQSENGFIIDVSTTAEGLTSPLSGPLEAPVGSYWELTSGENLTFRIGNSSVGSFLYDQLPQNAASAGLPYDDITEVVIYYEKITGAGTFKVQYSTDNVNYTDVTGLTSVDASTDGTGTAAVGFARATGLSNLSVRALRVLNLSGTVKIYGGGCMRDSGVVDMPWSNGGTNFYATKDDTRLRDIFEEEEVDCIGIRYLDRPQSGTDYEGFTQAAFADATLDDFDALWESLTTEPDILYISPNDTDSGTEVVAPADRAAYRQHAVDNDKTFVDTLRVTGFYAESNANGLMTDGTHENIYAQLLSVSRFLSETGLGQWPSGYNARTLQDIFAVGNHYFELSNSGIIEAPSQTGGTFGSDLALELRSAAANYGAGIGFNSTAASGRKYMVVSRGSGQFGLVDATSSARQFMTYTGASQLFRLGASGDKIGIGNAGTYSAFQIHANATLVAGTVTVTNANITTSSRIFVTRRSRGGTPGVCYEAIPAAGSFTINSYDGSGALQTSDTSQVAWFAVEP